MGSNQEGESAITIPLQYNNSVRNYIYNFYYIICHNLYKYYV